MTKILLIKTGAAGDVVRTTVLLQALEGAVTWVIDSRYQHLLPLQHPRLARIITVQQAEAVLRHEQFDHTISLEEDMTCALLAGSIRTKKLTGIYVENGRLTYTPDAGSWFDMSLVSRMGADAANRAKETNRASFQQLLLSMFGIPFRQEPYCIYRNPSITSSAKLIGIETRVGARWPNKGWSGYAALVQQLQQQGYACQLLEQRSHITEYLDDIARCSFIISGDTLAMHVAMAYRIPAIAIFNCTSPHEIYDYGILKKIVSPLLHEAFYKTSFSPAVVDSISVKEVYNAFVEHTGVKAVAL
jgi:heptosyltransferase-2